MKLEENVLRSESSPRDKVLKQLQISLGIEIESLRNQKSTTRYVKTSDLKKILQAIKDVADELDESDF